MQYASTTRGKTFGYVAYIDEAGDDGLKRIQPLDPTGSSEWLVISAVVVRADRVSETIQRTKALRGRLSRVIRPDIHFRFLRDENKELVCREIAKMRLRCFVVVSNKKNMRGYTNPNAARVPSANYFYCWLTRLLLERVSEFCHLRSRIDYGKPEVVRIEFSHREGFSYAQLKAYLYKLRMQSEGNALYLSKGDVAWPVIDLRQIHSFDHRQRSGLQLADCVASAFHEAVAIKPNGFCNPSFAKLLKDRMWFLNGRYLDKGIKTAPFDLRIANLAPQQREIFEFYGYPKTEW